MKVRGKILSLLCLLGISFSAFSVVVVCPDPSYFNDNPLFRDGRSENFIPGIGAVRVTYNAAPGSLFGRWRFMQEISGVLICYYFPAGSEGEGHTYIAFSSDSQQWKQGRNGPPWNGGICSGDRMSCYVTNN